MFEEQLLLQSATKDAVNNSTRAVYSQKKKQNCSEESNWSSCSLKEKTELQSTMQLEQLFLKEDKTAVNNAVVPQRRRENYNQQGLFAETNLIIFYVIGF